MPLLPSAITEYTNHIFDPIMNQVINRLIYKLGYKRIFEDRIYIKTNYRGPSDTSDGDNNAMLRADKFVAEATIQMQPDSVKWPTFNFNHTAAYGVNGGSIRNKNLILRDKLAKVSLWEQSSPCAITMSCRMHFLNKMHAYQTPHMINNMYLSGSILETNDLFFDYQLPGDIMKVLQVLHSLRDLPLDFIRYIREASSGIIGTDLNIRGDRPELVVKKAQTHALYSLEYTDEQPGTDETGSSPNEFIIPFTYTLQFNVPNLLFLEYPIIIDNKLVPAECIAINTVDHPPGYDDGGMTFTNMDTYYKYYKAHPKTCFVNPFYEDWIPPTNSVPARFTQDPFYIGTLLIEDPNVPMSISLKGDIGDGCTLDPVCQAILKQQGNDSFNYDALINICVYKDNYILDRMEMVLDENLNLKFYARDKSSIYRLVISQIRNVFKLNNKYWNLLFDYRDYFYIAEMLNHFFNKQVPYWKESTKGYHYDSHTHCYYDQSSKEIAFCVDEKGKMYKPVEGKLGSTTRLYLDNETFKPVGDPKHGSFTTFRILRADIQGAVGAIHETRARDTIY